MSKYWLVNHSSFSTGWIRSIVDYCNPHTMDFNIFILKKSLITPNFLNTLEIYPYYLCRGSNAFVIPKGIRKCRRPVICMFLDTRTKYPYASSKSERYRGVSYFKNENDFFIRALAHEIKHIENWAPKINAVFLRGNIKEIKKTYKKAEYDSQLCEQNIIRKLVRSKILQKT